MLDKLVYLLAINLISIIFYLDFKFKKLKIFQTSKDIIFLSYLILFSVLFYITSPRHFIFSIFMILMIFIWVVIFEVYRQKISVINKKFLYSLDELLINKNTLQNNFEHIDSELKRYYNLLNKYAYLFSLVQEINENIHLERITKEFYTKLTSYFGFEKISYVGIVIFKKKDIVEMIEYPRSNEEYTNIVKKILLEEKNILEIEKSNLIIYDIYNKNYGYLLLVGCKKVDEELTSEINFFVSETKLGFIRAILYREIEEISRTDGLTELYIRRYFNFRLNDELLRALRYNTNFSLLLIDIDFFKRVNDIYGHIVGDFVLKKLAKLIKDFIGRQGLCCRWGGEEFLVFVPYQDLEKVKNLAEELRQRVETTDFFYNNIHLKITISCGISHFPKDAKELDLLIAKADERLYKAKQQGRNRVIVE